jgi:hypothetical protein
MGELPVKELEALSLFLIPCSSDRAFLWCPQTPSGTICDIVVPGERTIVRARKKLFRPGGSTEVFLVQGSGLRDGASCELLVGSEAHARRARLARWNDPDTRAVLKVAAAHLAHEAHPAPILERYLSYISAWQAACTVLFEFSDAQMIEVDVPFTRAQVSAYGVTDQGLKRLTAHRLSERASKTIVWIAEPDIEHLYLELGDNLIRVNLSVAPRPTPRREGARIEGDDTVLVEALHHVAPTPSDDVDEWAASQCPPQATLYHRDATLTVLRAVRLPSRELVVFVNIAGAPEVVGEITLTPFGSPDPIETEIVRCHSDEPTSEWQQQIVLRAKGLDSLVGACRLDCSFGGEAQSLWISVTNSRDTDQASLAREFMSVATVKAEWFESIIRPLAVAYAHQTEPGLVGVREFGTEVDAQADVHVFAGSDIEALHRTIIGLALTSREAPIKVRIILANHSLFDQIAAAAGRWSQIYHLAIEVRCYALKSSEAQVIRSMWPTLRPGVYCRAGAVPLHQDWLMQSLHQFASVHATMLIGYMAECGRPLETAPGPADLFHAFGQPEAARPPHILAAAAIAPDRPQAAGLPRLFSLEAFLAAQAAQDRSATSMSLSFVPSGTMSHANEFDRRLDRSSLQKIAKSPLASGTRVIKLPNRAKS